MCSYDKNEIDYNDICNTSKKQQTYVRNITITISCNDTLSTLSLFKVNTELELLLAKSHCILIQNKKLNI